MAVRWSPRLRGSLGAVPELYEAKVTGTSWRVGVDREQIVACAACGRIVFLQRGAIGIDEGRWSGADFFNPDENPNIVLVTERVCRLLAAHNFTNYACYGPYPGTDVCSQNLP